MINAGMASYQYKWLRIYDISVEQQRCCLYNDAIEQYTIEHIN